MASQREIGLTYNWMDRFFPRVFGKNADISCALYDGDYSKSLAQAQRDKHLWVLKGVRFRPGDRVLDVGCGWGNMLRAVKDQGGSELGLTLSTAQAEACRDQGLKVRLVDWKEVLAGEIGSVEAVVSIGAFEHFCSIPEYAEGQQGQIYSSFFRFCAGLLPEKGRLYLQTMTWGEEVPSAVRSANPSGREKIVERMKVFYPGSWLPSGKEQILGCASQHFRLVESKNGRLDYIQTLAEWYRGINRFALNPVHWPSILAMLISNGWKDPRFLQRPLSLLYQDQREVFVHGVFDHQRLFFEKLG